MRAASACSGARSAESGRAEGGGPIAFAPVAAPTDAVGAPGVLAGPYPLLHAKNLANVRTQNAADEAEH